MLQESGAEVELASNFELSGKAMREPILARNCKTHQIPFSRSPLSKDNLRAYRELKKLLAENQYDIVHTHTPNASALVRLACRKLRKKGTRVFYTAHGFHFFSGAPLKNWLIYYPVERFLSRWTDVLITINKEDERRARAFHAKKTAYVHGVGIRTDTFCPHDYTRGERRDEIGIPQDAILLLSVGELNENKNHETAICALAELGDTSIYYVICGEGAKYAALERLSSELGLERQVKLVGVRSDVAQWMADADIYFFPSRREGLSVSLMEAMVSGLPVVCSDIRGNRDLIQNDDGGYLCAADSAEQYADRIRMMCAGPTLRSFGQRNIEKVKEFSMETVLRELKEIYEI